MKPMDEQTVLSLLGSRPNCRRLAEHLPTFLASHGFEDLAIVVIGALERGQASYDEGFDDGYDRGHTVGCQATRKAMEEAGKDMAGDAAPQQVTQ